jgi:hypothetical protein
MPSVRPEMKLEDPAPLMTPLAHPALPSLAGTAPSAQMALATIGLALCGAAIVAYAVLRRAPGLPSRPEPHLGSTEAVS